MALAVICSLLLPCGVIGNTSDLILEYGVMIAHDILDVIVGV